ncbi:arginine N-succinyltransferase [Simiduia sp. 21SJ11W-1]|uniref:arginine N-succinyltransferase n=1 Tax=Simiduia sp. 21SJ11W-1 TaxID=2909669 RepID=UPI00209D1ACA|nr:arginine N-succinyltransferase [Simiduia sp. 21SJ11W-1]UTA47714.1 arginine N-succinyltransferase [Simiduia sp. 21SJ11W-1]
MKHENNQPLAVRPVAAEDLAAIKQLMVSGTPVIGRYVLREWAAEQQVAEAILSHQYAEGESAGNIILVAEHAGKLAGFVELQSLAGYQFCALSFSIGHILHRSDSLSVCHAQKLLTLDQSLLGQGCISLCVIDTAVETEQAAVQASLLDAALRFVEQSCALFPEGIYVAVPGKPEFWAGIGERLTGIGELSVSHSHAELLPQSPLYESFIKAPLCAVLPETPVPAEKASAHTALASWLTAQGFSWQKKLYPIDGGLIYQWAKH